MLEARAVPFRGKYWEDVTQIVILLVGVLPILLFRAKVGDNLKYFFC